MARPFLLALKPRPGLMTLVTLQGPVQMIMRHLEANSFIAPWC